MFVFKLPEIGEGVVEGEIVRWMVSEGDPVAADQPICEVMTDKATVEISSPRGGTVARLHGSAGDVVAVHAPLVEIDDGAAPEVSSTPRAQNPPAAVAAPVEPPGAPGGKTLATPAVRSHARQAGVDIGRVPGSGPSGRVTRSDIEAFVAHADAIKAPPGLQLPPAAPVHGVRPDERVRIIGLRRKIAEKMVESYRTVPHFTYVDEVDATRLVELRRDLSAMAEARGVRLTYLAFIMKALVRVFRDFPTVNAVMDEERFELLVRGEVNIGIATDTEAGLYVPVVRNVENKSMLELAAEVDDLTRRTRENKVSLSELQGGTFTITSVGNIGGRFATPIINHPEVAILGVNQIHDRPMVVDGQIVARKMMYLSPSFDHRVIDGAVGARFVAALKVVLEQPSSLLLDLR